MQWLPAIRHANAGWLMPLSQDSAQLLCGIICDTSEQAGALADPDIAAEAIGQQLLLDPALTVFSLLELVTRHPETAGKTFDLESHAGWFCQVAIELFQDRNRQLLTEQLARKLGDQDIGLESCWQAIAKKTLELPIGQWIDVTGDWLELTGDLPPKSWLAGLPQIAIDEELDELVSSNSETNIELQVARLGYGRNRIDLYRIARNQQELARLRQRFSTRLHHEKMASLRQLAYGLSHEINNPLASIRTRAEQLMADERKEHRRDQLKRIVDSAMRSHEMIADMMYFAKPPKPQSQPVDALQLTAAVIDEFQREAGRRNIQLTMRVEERQTQKRASRRAGTTLRTVECDPRQVGDSLRALIRNALEAIGERGTIAVCVEQTSRRVSWVVADSGPGLTPEARQHAFDPYFSGREAGRGLGLGLCRVYRVARAHGGGASIEDTEVGCRARMWVPTKLRTAASD